MVLVWLFFCLCLIPVGAKIKVTKTFVEGDVEDIFWVSDQGVHVRTDKGFAYHSHDKGGSFTVFPECSNENCIQVMKPLPKKFKHLVLYHGEEKSWVVDVDGTVKQIIPHKLEDIIHHPVHLDWLLAVACTSALFDSREHCDLFVSKDAGKTLDLVAQDIWRSANFGWALPDASGFDDHLVFYVQPADFNMFELVKYHLLTKKTEVLVAGCIAYAQRYEFMFAAKLELGMSAELWVSDNNGKSWDPVHLPNDDIQLRFTIVDASEHMMFVNIYHQEGSTWGSTYSSDKTGQWFTSSLRYNRRNSKGEVDFHKVHGLNGAYIANIVAHYSDNLACQMCQGDEDCDNVCEYQSRITFDKGHTWQPLAVPEDDPICGGKASEECSLHLHAEATQDDRQSNIKTHEVSPGFILSSGNTGRKLAIGDDAVDLYLSRNGGVTWRKIKSGRWLYGFSDHGGLIILAAHDYTSVVWYSLDEGHSWVSFQFTDEKDGKVVVKKIVYNPLHPTSHEVILDTMTATQESRIYRLDFSALPDVRDCQGLTNPSDPSSDYEWWIPKGHGEKCFMGRLTKYAIRKSTSICWDESGAVRTVEVTNCTCSWDDFECDYGYVQVADPDGTPLCKPDQKVPVVQGERGECIDGRRRISQGYVKIADNWCTGGLNLDVIYEPCQVAMRRTGYSFSTILTIAVLAMAASFICINFGRVRFALDSFIHPLFRWNGGYRRANEDIDDDFDLEDDPHLLDDPDEHQDRQDDLMAFTSQTSNLNASAPSVTLTSGVEATKAQNQPSTPPMTPPRSPTSPSPDEPLVARDFKAALKGKAPLTEDAEDEDFL